jgi:DNA-binding NtrC family response regulator
MATIRLGPLVPGVDPGLDPLGSFAQTNGPAFLVGPRETWIALTEFVNIGRGADNTIALDDSYASARHARIEQKSYGYVVRDLRSRNGTYLNDTQVMEALLREQDVLRIGKTEFRFTARLVQETIETKTMQSKNPEFQEQLEKLPQIANLDIPVLILGPSGSGKELIAKAIHDFSARADGPFVSVNCSALSESLVESELFGHVKGSFTGATHDRKGAFEAARRGTLFLDEIGDLPLTLQPKLLRALENQEIRPVGSDRAVTTDVRIVAATHQSLGQKVQKSQFRTDLYYRLQGIQISPPALRDRLEDFDDLLFTFAKQYRVRFSTSAIAALKKHGWPGNIRELKNTVARAKAFFGNESIDEHAVQKLITPLPQNLDLTTLALRRSESGATIKSIERDLIISRLAANNGNQRRTADDLGIPKSTLHDRIRSYGIDLNNLPIPQF